MVVVTAALGIEFPAVGSPPKRVVKATHEKINEFLRRERAHPGQKTSLDRRIKGLVEQLIDFDVLARSAMGKRWGQLDEAKQKTFVDLFRELVERSYLNKLRGRLDYTLQYGRAVQFGNGAKVAVTVVRMNRGRRETTDIEYRMRRLAGRWRVVDVVTNQVSLARNYRRSFARIMRRDGYDGLIRKMKRKIAKL
ncbi:MAG: ABC transporter substrate-binding protein [Deltaproteobacteria bacterium]|nr:ABC transporter substrate-binding protein [Deltaproteobacteria bacterium]